MRNFNPIYLFGMMMVLSCLNFCNAGQSVKNLGNSGISTDDSLFKAGKYTLVEAFPNLKFDDPVELTSPNDNTDRVFLVAQKRKNTFTAK